MPQTDTPLATYTYFSWLRRGISTEIIRKDDGTGPQQPRAQVPIGVEFNAAPPMVQTQLELYGPGEITGFDQRAVIRTSPARDVFNAETNFFPMIEFDQPDLPWRYTPASAANRRLRPWLCLIVLADGEFVRPDTPPDPNRPFPWVTVKSQARLPDLSQSWAWAHAQLSGEQSGEQGIDDAALTDVLKNEPRRLISRLLCPRRLSPRTAYTAMLVPAFERGRLRGIGREPDEMRTVPLDGLEPAWENDHPDFELPVYYEWRFQTGEQGDFEFLVNLLKANPLPDTVGVRGMDVSEPGIGLPGASTKPLGLEGALTRPPGLEDASKTAQTGTKGWEKGERHAFIQALRAEVNRPSDLIRIGAPASDPSEPPPKQTVAPPLYARWHAAQETLDEVPHPDEQTVWWFQDLNSDPRLRATAGLGTQVVQSQQRQLLEGAWRQVGAVRPVNQMLRWAQCGRELSVRINQRHIASADQESILLLTAPLHGRVPGGQNTPVIQSGQSRQSGRRAADGRDALADQGLLAGPKTIRALAQASPIATGAFDAALRRLRRPNGPLGRRQGRPELLRNTNRVPNILGRMDQGEFSPAPVRQAPPQMSTPARLGKSLVPEWCTRMRLEKMSKNPTAFEADLLRRAAIRDDFTLSVSQMQRAPRSPHFIASITPLGTQPPPAAKPPAQGGALQFDSQPALAFRTATTAMLARANAQPEQSPDLFILNVESAKNRMMSALDPNTTIPARVGNLLRFSSRVNLTNDPLEPVGPAPEFNQAMYEPLSKLSQDWLLPGLDQVPPNTVALLRANQRFIEAYMAGLNHEMARELLFNEYPLRDQRGTYFRQFWSVAGFVGQPGQTVDPETLKDIKSIHAWGRSAALGKNSGRTPKPSDDQVVLLVRGELLRRYPNTIVYAAEAGPVEAGKHTLPDPTEERHPIFSGTLKPDVSFFGFDLTVDKARAEPGWFFVLMEQPTEPRFGLDENRKPDERLDQWRNLIWSDLEGSENGLSPGGYIDLAKENPPDLSLMKQEELEISVWHADPPLPRIDRGSTAADLAYIALQLPVRIAIHASDMLPKPFVPDVSLGGFING
jgi:hypothetical protein